MISEDMFYALHPEEREEEMKFDCLFLLDLVPDEKEWIFELMK